jgi:hypothetical protein
VSVSVAHLRELIEQKFPDAIPLTHRTTEELSTGIAALDGILPSGGLPRGKLTAWTPYGGATAILRAACRHTALHGERSAWIDGGGSIVGAYWQEGPLLVRPHSRRQALRATEELLRCSGFSLVVLSGIEPESAEMVRLTRAAKDGGAAIVALTTRTALSTLRIESRFDPHGWRWRRTPFGDPADAREVRVRVQTRSMGWSARAEFLIPVLHHELRLSLEPGLVDRRGLRTSQGVR